MSYVPIVATKKFSFLRFGTDKNNFITQWVNPLSYKIVQFLTWQTDRRVINTFRQKLNLSDILFFGVTSRKVIPQNLKKIPIIHYFSPTLIPRPQDWSKIVYITGHLLLEDKLSYQPLPSLTDFLSRGEKPIYIGFGSMAVRESRWMTETIIEALRLSGQRAILLSGWANLGKTELPKSIYLLNEYVPFGWLFPRMKAVIHHGGSGTVALGLRSGVPQVILPFFADQPAWGQRLFELGVAPPPLPVKKLTARKLSILIDRAIADPKMQKQAKEIAVSLRQENGVEEAVNVIKSYLS